MQPKFEDLVTIGKILKTQGRRGEVRVLPLTDFDKRFEDLSEVSLVTKDRVCKVCKIKSVWYHRSFVILGFEHIDSISEAEKLRGAFVNIKREDIVKLPQGSYYFFEIIGLTVFTDDDKCLGKIVDVLRTGSNDVYIVKDDRKKEYLIPAIKSVIRKISLEEKKMIIHPLEGLI